MKCTSLAAERRQENLFGIEFLEDLDVDQILRLASGRLVRDQVFHRDHRYVELIEAMNASARPGVGEFHSINLGAQVVVQLPHCKVVLTAPHSELVGATPQPTSPRTHSERTERMRHA